MKAEEEMAAVSVETSKAPSAALDVRDLYVSFHRRGRELPVLRGVSVHIEAGQSYGLVGESGCGKTTLALAVVRYLARNGTVDAGSILVDGDDVQAFDEETLRRWRGERVAMVYQDPASALNPSMRIGDQLAEVFRFHRSMTSAEAFEKARESLERVAMPDPRATLRRYPFELSGGQQQRVVIAKALAHNPRLLILDEPTTGLDATVEAEVLDLIEELRCSVNSAILLISHNLGLVARLCERVGVLYAGRIVEEGAARELFSEPRHPYTMGLLRCVPRFGMYKGNAALQPIPGALPALGELLPGCVYAKRCMLAQPVCTRQEPDLFPWPSSLPDGARLRAEEKDDTPTAPAVDGTKAVDFGRRRVRCYFPQRTPELPEVVAPRSIEPSFPAGDGVLLQVEGVRRSFRDGQKRLVAVSDVSLQVKRGETLGLVGESGSGKTTLARCITGLLAPENGKLVFEDHPLRGMSSRRNQSTLRAIQMVFQNPDSTLNPAWSTRKILQRAVHKLSRLDRAQERDRVEHLASSVRVEPRFLQQRPTELSGGQRQRIAIARAFAGSPSLVVCDEPASALDVSVQASILNLLADLQATQGVSYVFISHDLAVVRYLADHIAVMYLAELMELGASEEVFNPPHHPYTEALFSAIPSLDFDSPHRRIELRGPVPSLSDPPTGCRFHTRCHRFLGDICVDQAPPWQQVSDGHVYKCHIPPIDLRPIQVARAWVQSNAGALHASCLLLLPEELSEKMAELIAEAQMEGHASRKTTD